MKITRQWHKHLVRIGSMGGKAAMHKPLTQDVIDSLRRERDESYCYARQFEPGTNVEWEITGKKYSGVVVSRKYTKVTVKYNDGTDDTVMVKARFLRKKVDDDQSRLDSHAA